MEYKVVPFTASIDPKKGKSDHVAEQLETLIKNYNNRVWEYIRLEGVSTYVHPDSGCFGIGAQAGYTTIRQMAVFKK
jgi:hypothetical protein